MLVASRWPGFSGCVGKENINSEVSGAIALKVFWWRTCFRGQCKSMRFVDFPDLPSKSHNENVKRTRIKQQMDQSKQINFIQNFHRFYFNFCPLNSENRLKIL